MPCTVAQVRIFPASGDGKPASAGVDQLTLTRCPYNVYTCFGNAYILLVGLLVGQG